MATPIESSLDSWLDQIKPRPDEQLEEELEVVPDVGWAQHSERGISSTFRRDYPGHWSVHNGGHTISGYIRDLRDYACLSLELARMCEILNAKYP